MPAARMRWLLFLALLCLLLALPQARAAEHGGIGAEVGYLKGRAWLLDGEAPDARTHLEQGQRLTVPALVQAGQGARLELVFPDGSVFRLAGPGMLLVRDAFSLANERSIDLELSRGLGWFGLRPFAGTADLARLVLPASVLQASAVQCEVRVGPDRRVMLGVFGGAVRIAAGREGDPAMRQDGAAAPPDSGGADIFLEYGGLGKDGPVDTGGLARELREGEQVLLTLSGRISEKRTMTPFERRDSAWASWNIARDREESLDLIQE